MQEVTQVSPAELLLSICKNVFVKYRKRHVDKKLDYVFMPQGHGFDSMIMHKWF